MEFISCVEYAEIKREELKQRMRRINRTLEVILVENNMTSNLYLKYIQKELYNIGIAVATHKVTSDNKKDEIIELIHRLNRNRLVDSILVLKPYNKDIESILSSGIINSSKDIDGVGSLCTYEGNGGCTVKGILDYLKFNQIDLCGKNVTIINRSNSIGRLLAKQLINFDATVTICHSKTKDLSMFTKTSDIIITAVGKSGIITEDMLGNNKPIILDVGITKNEAGIVCGDVDYNNVKDKCLYCTPVLNGVALLTKIALAEKVIESTDRW